MKLTTWIAALPLLLLAAPAASAHERCTKAECAAVKAKIRKIEAKMRSGYSLAQGERYERRLRELRDRRYRVCR